MLALIQYNLPTLAVALLIGVATGWWAFRRRGVRTTDRKGEDSSPS